jgi:hypothetical protein
LTDQPSADEPGQQSHSERGDDAARRRANWGRAAAAAGVLVLVAVAAFLLLGGDVPGVNVDHAGPGEFSFVLKKVRAIPLSHTPPADLQDEAELAGADVKATMDELYSFAYVDADSWSDYGSAYELFDDPASAQAEEDTDILTLGSTAKDLYEAVTPGPGTIRIVVLTDRKDAPVSAVAQVFFRAAADLKDGSSTVLTSSGAFFLRKSHGEWRIYAYRVDRHEEAAERPSPTTDQAS